MTDQIPEDTFERITSLLQVGDQLSQSGNHSAALEKFRMAVALVPDPFNQWDISATLLTSIGDAYWELGDVEKAEQAFKDVLECASALANPYIRLRRGEIMLAQGNTHDAEMELALAFMNGGEEVFEDEAQKLLSVAKEVLSKAQRD